MKILLKDKFLETDRIFLRNINENDLDDFHHYRSSPELAKYQSWNPFSRKQALEYLLKYSNSELGTRGQWTMLGIFHKSDNLIIGDVSLKVNAIEPRNGEIGCTLSKDYHHRGLAKEAISLILDYAFSKLKMHRIIGITDTRNSASIQLMLSLGMKLEAYYNENIWFKGAWCDEYQFAILEKEWKK